MTPADVPDVAYSFDDYAHVWDRADWSMDKRHIYWMYDVLRSRKWGKTLEIGSLHGATATAFVEATNRGHIERSYFCDVEITIGLKKTLAHLREPERAEMLSCRGARALRDHGPFDFVFVDGDHSLRTITEETQILLRQHTLCVMAHDTSATTAGYPYCEGPQHLKQEFQTHADYFCLEDNATREGESTGRGLFFASRDPVLFSAAKPLLRRWSRSAWQNIPSTNNH